MPPKTSRRQANKRLHNQLEDAENVEQSPPKRPRTSQHRQSEHQTDDNVLVESYSPDASSTAKPAAEKPMRLKETYANKFTRNVEEHRNTFQGALQDWERNFAEADKNFVNALKTQIDISLELPTPQSKTPEPNQNTSEDRDPDDDHLLRDRSCFVSRRAQTLEDHYQIACETVDQNRLAHIPGAGWDHDRNILESELRMGHKVVERHIVCAFKKENSATTMDVADEVAHKDEERVSRLLGMRIPQLSKGVNRQLTLNETMRYAESGVKRLSKGLPVKADNTE